MAARSNTSVDHDRIWHLHRQGLSSSVIAERMGCTRRTVNTVIQERRDIEAAAARRAAS